MRNKLQSYFRKNTILPTCTKNIFMLVFRLFIFLCHVYLLTLPWKWCYKLRNVKTSMLQTSKLFCFRELWEVLFSVKREADRPSTTQLIADSLHRKLFIVYILKSNITSRKCCPLFLLIGLFVDTYIILSSCKFAKAWYGICSIRLSWRNLNVKHEEKEIFLVKYSPLTIKYGELEMRKCLYFLADNNGRCLLWRCGYSWMKIGLY